MPRYKLMEGRIKRKPNTFTKILAPAFCAGVFLLLTFGILWDKFIYLVKKGDKICII